MPWEGGMRRRLRNAQKADRSRTEVTVESRMGAVAWGQRPALRFPSPLIEPDVPISGIRLSDWLHREAHGVVRATRGSCVRLAPSAFALRYSFL